MEEGNTGLTHQREVDARIEVRHYQSCPGVPFPEVTQLRGGVRLETHTRTHTQSNILRFLFT